VTVRVPFKEVKSVRLSTADAGVASGPMEHSDKEDDEGTVITVKIPRLEVALMVMVERAKP